MLNGETEQRVLLTVALIAAIIIVSWLLQTLMRVTLRGHEEKRVSFWGRQIVRLLGIVAVIIGIIEIWHPSGKSAGGAIGLITAGVAVALQRVITSFAAYLIILRGTIFNVGDRITMGGVRGDVIALDFMQTTVLEIGETPGEQGDAPISYKDNRGEAERILLEVAHKHTDDIVREAKPHIEKLAKEYRLATTPEIDPRVYMRLTDNWVNFSLRFLVRIEGGRALKDRISRDLIDGLDAAGIGIASGTYEIVGMPKLEVQLENRV
jgi:small-conductance mechanosensitive channel